MSVFKDIVRLFLSSTLGADSVRPNIIVFGADQIVNSRYFDKCVVAINMANILVSLIAVFIPFGDKHCFFKLYVSGSVMLRYYIHVKPFVTIIASQWLEMHFDHGVNIRNRNVQ